MKQIHVLSTLINGRKNYVADQMATRTYDNKKIVNYTIHEDRARGFASEEDATNFIEDIVNPHERIYRAETIEIDPEKLSMANEVLDELR